MLPSIASVKSKLLQSKTITSLTKFPLMSQSSSLKNSRSKRLRIRDNILKQFGLLLNPMSLKMKDCLLWQDWKNLWIICVSCPSKNLTSTQHFFCFTRQEETQESQSLSTIGLPNRFEGKDVKGCLPLFMVIEIPQTLNKWPYSKIQFFRTLKMTSKALVS